MGGWGWYGPRRYGYGGGCLGGMMSMILVPVILVVMVILAVVSNTMSGVGEVVQGGSVRYDEEVFQDYANAQYQKEFGSSSAYEDNLLIVFLTSEDHYDYSYIAWVGDHIVTDVNWLLGSNDTELGWAMSQSINQSSYKYSLDSNLAQVMQQMTKEIQDLGLESSFDCTEDHVQVSSHLTNYTQLELTNTTVNDALTAFTQATGIPAVIVVEDMEDVFGRSVSTGSAVSVFLVIAVVILVIVLLVNAGSRRRQQGTGSAEDDRTRQYRQFDDQY